MGHQARKDSDFFSDGKKKNLIKPYDCLTHHLESVQTIVKRAATPAEPRSFLVLRTYR